MSEVESGLEITKVVVDLASKVFGPSLTRRQASADAESEVIGALAKQLTNYIEAFPNNSDIMDAIISCGGKLNLGNLVNIVHKAAPQLNETATPALIKDDWIANFKEKARTCSDDEMSDLWAQLLAGEANCLGSYSRKTVNVLADMDADDAKSFSNLCRFQLMDPLNKHGRMLATPELDARIYVVHGITTDVVDNLRNIGLVIFESGMAQANTMLDRRLLAHSKGILEFVTTDGTEINRGGINSGALSFTNSGWELSKLCLPIDTPDDFVEWLIDNAIWGSNVTAISHSGIAVGYMDREFAHIHPDIGRLILPRDEQPTPYSCQYCLYNRSSQPA